MLFTWRYWLLGIIIFLLSVNICLSISPQIITRENIVLTFIGILATFVVVSNYAQVKDVEYKSNEKIKGIEDKLQQSIETINDKIDYATMLFVAQLLNKKSEGSFLKDKRNYLIQLLQEEFPNQKAEVIKGVVDYYYKIEYNTSID